MHRLYDKIIDGLAFVAVVLLFAIMIGIGLDVAARYFFGDPIGWMMEFVQHSLLFILFLGMPWLTREGGHVSIDMLVDALPVTGRRILIGAGLVVAGLTAGFIAVWAGVSTVDNFRRGVETNGIYPIPRAWMIGVMALGLALTAVEFLRRSYKIFLASDDEIMGRHGDLGAEP
jgi:C4-dicarboxylate transporter DctQ subunit